MNKGKIFVCLLATALVVLVTHTFVPSVEQFSDLTKVVIVLGIFAAAWKMTGK